jgi:hypothetical protein
VATQHPQNGVLIITEVMIDVAVYLEGRPLRGTDTVDPGGIAPRISIALAVYAVKITFHAPASAETVEVRIS